jgi:hypothetical protein
MFNNPIPWWVVRIISSLLILSFLLKKIKLGGTLSSIIKKHLDFLLRLIFNQGFAFTKFIEYFILNFHKINQDFGEESSMK